MSIITPDNGGLKQTLRPQRTVKAAPQITAEATADVESMIKKRITERRFDDVVRVVPPPLEKETRVVELDDSKSKKVRRVLIETYGKFPHGHSS
jgi:U3 small nucleolar RNA-associated protein MPP10